jgi:hypothetical protein
MTPEELAMEELARIKGVSVTQLRMLLAAPTDVVRAIVMDNRNFSNSTSLLPPKPGPQAEPQRGNGWATPTPLGPPPGVALCDRMVDQQDRIDRRELERRLKGEAK